MKSVAILPVYNEATHITSLMDKFPKASSDFLLVDDGSTDGTSEAIRKAQYPSIRHTVKSGVGKCLQDGFRYAIDQGYDTVVVMAGNGKDDPTEIPRLLKAIQDGADYVQGSRFLKQGSWNNLPWKRWTAIKLFTLVWSCCTFKWLTDVTNGFRAYRINFLKDPHVRWDQKWLETYELEYYLHYKALRLNIRFQEIPVTKNYPTKKNYSKIRPGMDWFNIIRPLFLLMTGVKD